MSPNLSPLFDLTDYFSNVESWFSSFAIAFSMVLAAAAAIWLAAIAWRKFKESTNKV